MSCCSSEEDKMCAYENEEMNFFCKDHHDLIVDLFKVALENNSHCCKKKSECCLTECPCCKGHIDLVFGKHEVSLKTNCMPKKVFFSVNHSCGHQVCGSDVNKVGYTLLEDGFVLYADIHSDKARVEWICFGEKCNLSHCCSSK